MKRATHTLLGFLVAVLAAGPHAWAADGTNGSSGPATLDYDTDQLFDSQDPPHYIVDGTVTLTQTGHGTVTLVSGADNTRYAGGSVVFGNPTATESRTFTSVATGTATGSGYGTPQTEFQTWTDTSGVTVTESSTVTFSDTASVSNTGTWTRTVLYGSPPNGWFLRTATSSTTKTLTGDITGTETSLAIGGTITLTGTRTGSGTSTVTVTGTRTSTIAGLLTMTASGSGTRPASATMTYTGTRTRTATDSGSYFGTATHTGVVTGTSTCSGSLTYTATDYLTATVTNKNSNFIVSSTITSITPVINSASFNTQTVTTPSGVTKTWTSTISLTGTDVCKSSPGNGDIPCLGTNSKFSTAVIPPSTDVLRAGANVELRTGTDTATLSVANIKDGVTISASPSATATTTATATNTLYAADSTIRFGTDSNNVTATSATVASNPYMRANGSLTPTAYTMPIAESTGKLDNGWLNTATASATSKIVQAKTDGKIDISFLPAATASAASALVQAKTDGKIDTSFLPLGISGTLASMSYDDFPSSDISTSGTWATAYAYSYVVGASPAVLELSSTVTFSSGSGSIVQCCARITVDTVDITRTYHPCGAVSSQFMSSTVMVQAIQSVAAGSTHVIRVDFVQALGGGPTCTVPGSAGDIIVKEFR